MCGIVGFTGQNKKVLQQMVDKVDHRGDDDVATYSTPTVSLGMKRLAIIDLSKSIYPLFSKNKNHLLIFNGEIYNYQQLIRKHSLTSNQLQTQADCEIILFLYQKYGPKCLKYLDGMFAFALYDKEKELLFCARDRFGEKPFFYSIKGGEFIFGSEAKSLLPHPNISSTINPQSLYYYLRFGFAPNNKSMFQDVLKLQPGHSLIWHIKSKRLSINQYWDINFSSRKKSLSFATSAKQLDELLNDAVKNSLASDVPYGSFLSGGLDSSLTTALLQQYSSAKIPTFSIKVDHSGYDESDQAKEVAKILGTQHHTVAFSYQDIKKYLPKLQKHADEPICDPGAFPSYKLSHYAQKRIKVVFTGQGADELFAGYEWYIRMQAISKRYHLIPKIIRSNANLVTPYRFLQIFSPLSVSYFPPQYFTRWQVDNLLQPEYKSQIKISDPFTLFKDLNFDHPLDMMQYTDIKSYLVDHLLTQADRVTMANNIEARTIFLNHHLAQYVASLPPSFRLNKKFGNKYILRKVAEKYLPHHICWQNKKGFSLPLGYWINNNLKDFVRSHLDKISDLNLPLKSDRVNALLNQHSNGQDRSTELWSLICLINWYQHV